MTPEIAAMVKGLSEAQKQAMWLLPDEFDLWPISIARITLKRLKERELLAAEAPAGFGLVKHKFTPLGLAVRQHLRAQQEQSQ